LYRATNVNEKEDMTNPFFSYAQNRKTAERFLTFEQKSFTNRTGEIEEIEVAPKDTFGLFPSDEEEILIPNPKYEELNNQILELENYAKSNGVELPYDHDDLLEMTDKRGIGDLGFLIKRYVDSRKR
jgi:hypothetical protein